MENNMTVSIETFEFETRYASQDYVKCGLSIKFEKEDREFKIVFDNKSLAEIISEIEMYFGGEIAENTNTVYYVPWVVGNYVIYQITFMIDVEQKKWFFRYKKSQNDAEFGFVYEISENELRSLYEQIKSQYDAVNWNNIGKSEIYTFKTPDTEFEWCYSAKSFESAIGSISNGKEIRSIYVSAMNYRDPLRVKRNFVNYYLGSEVIVEFDDYVVDLLVHAQGLYQWRIFDKKDIEIVGPKTKFIDDGDEEFCKIGNVYEAFELEYLNSRIESVKVDKTTYWPWAARGFDKSKLEDPIELPENLHFNLANGNTLSFLGWDDDFVIKISNPENLDS